MGRPTKKTAETIEKVCFALRQGATISLACQYAGIAPKTFRDWRSADEALRQQVEAIESKAAIAALERIHKGADEGSWQAAAWFLERRFPRDFGRQIREVEGTLGVVELPSVEQQNWAAPE